MPPWPPASSRRCSSQAAVPAIPRPAWQLRLGEGRFPGRQGRLLFAYLVAEQGRPVPRDELAEALWGETPPATWEKALTVVASKVRAVLADSGLDATAALTGAHGCYRLELPRRPGSTSSRRRWAARRGEGGAVGGRSDQGADGGDRGGIARRTALPAR